MIIISPRTIFFNRVSAVPYGGFVLRMGWSRPIDLGVRALATG
jgi:hypothetical protein